MLDHIDGSTPQFIRIQVMKDMKDDRDMDEMQQESIQTHRKEILDTKRMEATLERLNLFMRKKIKQLK